jgi:hypothetical protein
MKESIKPILVLFAALTALSGFSCNSNTGHEKKPSDLIASADTAVIIFKEYEHDFGKIIEGEKVASIFTFENKGKGPLVILSVATSCGCTVPKYDTKPIDPGSTGTLEVVFDSSGKTGKQSKTITVRSNALQSTVLLKISGEVITSTNN